jgi:hypothetical protein
LRFIVRSFLKARIRSPWINSMGQHQQENDSWRFKTRSDDHPTIRARSVSATPASSDGASATLRTRRSKGSKLDADVASNLGAD